MLKIPSLPYKTTEIKNEHPFVVEAFRHRKDHEKCWCASGIKYRKCHKDRENLAPLRLIEILAQTHRAFWQESNCLYPSHAECEGPIVNAHTIQRKGVLEKIARSHHVYKLDVNRADDRTVEVQKISWKKASTFPGFCSKHDSTIFREIETVAFEGTHKQCLVQAYRSLCNEIYKKTGSVNSLKYQKQVIDRGKSIDNQISFQMSANKTIENSLKTISELELLKAKYERALFENKSDLFKSSCYFFVGDLGVVSSGTAHFEYTFSGEKLVDIWDLSIDAKSIIHSIMSTSTGGAFFFCWEADSECGEKFIESFDFLSDQDKGNIFIQYCFLQSENNFFSLEWWNSLGAGLQSWIKVLFRTHYYAGGSYNSRLGLCDWTALRKAPR